MTSCFRSLPIQEGEPREDDVGVMFTEIFVKDPVGYGHEIYRQPPDTHFVMLACLCRRMWTFYWACSKNMTTGCS